MLMFQTTTYNVPVPDYSFGNLGTVPMAYEEMVDYKVVNGAQKNMSEDLEDLFFSPHLFCGKMAYDLKSACVWPMLPLIRP